MWNVFDSSFIVVTTLYLILRLKGLFSGDREFASYLTVSDHLIRTGFNSFYF